MFMIMNMTSIFTIVKFLYVITFILVCDLLQPLHKASPVCPPWYCIDTL